MIGKHKVNIKYLRCDNAGENKRFEEEVQKLNYAIKFEYTSANTPQQNGVAERIFATLYGRI